MIRNKKGIIFDFDGTLADTFDIGIRLINDIARQSGKKELNQSVEEIRKMSAKMVLKNMNIPFWQTVKTLASAKKAFNERFLEVELFEGVPELIRALSEKYQLGVISSNSTEAIEKVFRNNAVDPKSFDVILGGTSLSGKTKKFKIISKQLSIKTAQLIYVGDEMRDVKASSSFGIEIIYVSWGYNSKDVVLPMKPDYIADNIRELTSLLISDSV